MEAIRLYVVKWTQLSELLIKISWKYFIVFLSDYL